MIPEGSLTISVVNVYDEFGTNGRPMFRRLNCFDVKTVTIFNDLLTANILEGFTESRGSRQAQAII